MIRKFIIECIPEGNFYNKVNIFTSYLLNNVNNKIILKKVVKVSGSCFFLRIIRVNYDNEFKILPEEFGALNTAMQKTLEEEKKFFLIDDFKAWISEYNKDEIDTRYLKTVSVEFKNEIQATNFTKPEWFGKEIIGNYNEYLWLKINGRCA